MQLRVQPTEKDLGSGYIITIPENYQILEHHGVDYVDFGLLPIDSTAENLCDGGIIFGNSVGAYGPGIYKKNKQDIINSKILGKDVIWKIYDLDSGFFAEAFVQEQFCASIISKQKSGIIDFLKVFESIRKK